MSKSKRTEPLTKQERAAVGTMCSRAGMIGMLALLRDLRRAQAHVT